MLTVASRTFYVYARVAQKKRLPSAMAFLEATEEALQNFHPLEVLEAQVAEHNPSHE